MPLRVNVRKCLACNGTGKTKFNLYCSFCNGTGKIEQLRFYPERGVQGGIHRSFTKTARNRQK